MEAKLPTSTLELSISCAALKNKDFLSKSDPFCAVYTKESSGPQDPWRLLGVTETIMNNPNPKFAMSFKVPYRFEEVQWLKIEIYDEDNADKKHNLQEQDFLGEVIFQLHQVVGAKGQTKPFHVCKEKGGHALPSFHSQRSENGSSEAKYGVVTVHVEELAHCAEDVKIQFEATKLDNLDGLFSKSDPFLVVLRSGGGGAWIPVWQSEVIKNNLSPIWNPTIISVQNLCNGDYDRPLRIECRDCDKNGKSEEIGSLQASLRELMHNCGQPWDLINQEKKKKKGKKYTNSGFLVVKTAETLKHHTFLDYLRGGCELNLMIGIDYTQSNGAPHDPRSLHFQNPQQMNEYQSAIAITGSILQEYDSDKIFPVYGFGGTVNGSTSHCFPLNMNDEQPGIFTIDGVLQVYSSSLLTVGLSGPTFFGPLIQKAHKTASQAAANGSQTYFILLIITDGVIMDMDQTIDTLVQASTSPLSVVIVGVGNADFSAMDALDGDGRMLTDRAGSRACRDIVQFIPMNKFRGQSMASLTSEVLAEIPKQLVDYMKAAKIAPKPPVVVVGSIYPNEGHVPPPAPQAMPMPDSGMLPNNPAPWPPIQQPPYMPQHTSGV